MVRTGENLDQAAIATSILDTVKPLVDLLSIATWRPGEPLLPLILRGVVRRQYDVLRTAIDLERAGNGHACAPLLRPACEELFWINYLCSLPPPKAELLVRALVTRELAQHVIVQSRYSGLEAMKQLGLDAYLGPARKNLEAANRVLRDLAESERWPQANKKKDLAPKLPSVHWLAERAGALKEYEYLYHATSRFVHFSTTELLRLFWGAPGHVRADAAHYQGYGAAFVIYWGTRQFISTVGLILEDAEAYLGFDAVDVDGSRLVALAEQLRDTGAVPIITAEELRWPIS